MISFPNIDNRINQDMGISRFPFAASRYYITNNYTSAPHVRKIQLAITNKQALKMQHHFAASVAGYHLPVAQLAIAN